MAIEHKVVACEKQEDIDVWDQEIQSETYVYNTIIETLEYQIEKLRRESTEKQELGDGLIKGPQNEWEIHQPLKQTT